MSTAGPATVRIPIRTSQPLKDEVTRILDEMGIDLTISINMFLAQTVPEGALPLPPLDVRAS